MGGGQRLLVLVVWGKKNTIPQYGREVESNPAARLVLSRNSGRENVIRGRNYTDLLDKTEEKLSPRSILWGSLDLTVWTGEKLLSEKIL